MSDGHDHGTIYFAVDSDRSVEGYGEIWTRYGSSWEKMFELRINGTVKPNGSLECQYDWSWVNPAYNLSSIIPTAGKKFVKGIIEGYLNPALNYGKGICLTQKMAFLCWLVHRQE